MAECESGDFAEIECARTDACDAHRVCGVEFSYGKRSDQKISEKHFPSGRLTERDVIPVLCHSASSLIMLHATCLA